MTENQKIAEIAKIEIGTRHRKEMGDVKSLAESIAEIGLLHPVVIDDKGTLIAGERRIRACQSLGWDSVPVTVIPLDDIVRGEYSENAFREDFRPSEIDAIRRALEPAEKAAAKERQEEGRNQHSQGSGNFPEGSKGETRDKIGKLAGVSGRTVDKIAEVVQAAEESPEEFGKLVEEMDKSGKVDRAHKKLKKAKKQAAAMEMASMVPSISDRYQLHHANFTEAQRLEDNSVDFIITDPPYPAEYLNVFDGLGLVAANVLKPGGLALVMVGETYLPDIIAMLGKHLTYHWALAYLTPGGQAVQQFDRKVNTFWKPVLVYRKGEYTGDWFGDVVRSDTNDNDKEHHHWGQSVSGMRDLMRRFVKPGNVVLDPFLGGGTTAVVTLEMGASFIGYDIDPGAIETTKARIGEIHATVVV